MFVNWKHLHLAHPYIYESRFDSHSYRWKKLSLDLIRWPIPDNKKSTTIRWATQTPYDWCQHVSSAGNQHLLPLKLWSLSSLLNSHWICVLYMLLRGMVFANLYVWPNELINQHFRNIGTYNNTVYLQWVA